MDTVKIDKPPVFEHTLTAQEVEMMRSAPDGERKLAIAIDWNILNQKYDFIVRHTIQNHNLLVEHDRIYQFLKAVATIICAGGGLLGVLKILQGLGVL